MIRWSKVTDNKGNIHYFGEQTNFEIRECVKDSQEYMAGFRYLLAPTYSLHKSLSDAKKVAEKIQNQYMKGCRR